MANLKRWFHTITFGETAKYLKLCAWMFVDSFVASIPFGVMMFAIYILMMPISNPGQSLQSPSLWILTGVLAAQTIAYMFVRRRSYVNILVGYSKTTKRARIKMGEHLKSLSMGFFFKRDAGDLSTVILRDYDTVESTAGTFVPQMTVIIIRLTLSIVVFAAYEWRMLISMLAVIPVAIPFAVSSYKKMTVTGSELLETQQKTSSLILEYVGGIQTLRAFNQAGSRFQSLKGTFARLKDNSKDMESAAAPIAMIGRAILSSGLAVVMGVGAVLLISEQIDPFLYLMVLLVSAQIYEPIMALFTFIAGLSMINSSVGRIQDLYNEEPLPEPKHEVPPQNTEIVFNQVRFGYGEREVLHGISLTIPENNFVALVGASGSGKSTITRLVARFWDISSGEITMGGVPYRDISTDLLLSKISMVFQDVYLFHDTIEENIRLGRSDATTEEIMKAAKTAVCHDFIMSLPDGYQTVVGEGGSTLSGGEKQRISIARALLKNAPIVLLDEATSSLDSKNEVLIQRAINELVKDKTVIVIAHRLQSIATADHIVVLDDGRVAESGTHEELLEQDGLYTMLWQEQNKAGNWSLE
ncbi:MAG: ABC transporter ATP-binding protein [Suipraeoptans sp.]